MKFKKNFLLSHFMERLLEFHLILSHFMERLHGFHLNLSKLLHRVFQQHYFISKVTQLKNPCLESFKLNSLNFSVKGEKGASP